MNQENFFNFFDIIDDDHVQTAIDDVDPDINYLNDFDTLYNDQACRYYGIDEFNDLCAAKDLARSGSKADSLGMIHVNIRSVSKNLSNLENYLQTLKYDFRVVGLSETWFNENNHDLHTLCGYTVVSNYRTNRVGGGVSLMIDSDLKMISRNDLNSMSDSIESVFVELCDVGANKCNIIIGVVYRPPASDGKAFLESLAGAMSLIEREGKKSVLMGDFNLDLLTTNSNSITSEFIELMYAHSHMPLITKPTRIDIHSSSATLIDNIFINNTPHVVKAHGISCVKIADHFPVFCILNNDFKIEPLKPKPQRIISERHVGQFITHLSSENWENVMACNDAAISYKLFLKKFKDVYEKCFPYAQPKSVYKDRKPWLTLSLKKSIKTKNKLYTRYLHLKTIESKSNYTQYRNRLKSVMKAAEKQHYSLLMTVHKNNLKKSWKVIKEVINKNKANFTTQQFLINETVEKDPSKIAESFNEYFVGIGPKLAEQIPPTAADPAANIEHRIRDSIFLEPTDDAEVSTLISSLKDSSPGWDEISSRVCRSSVATFVKPFTHVLNLSLSQGVVPQELKIARVTPIFKAGDKQMLSNYRPISVLPYFSKILEKLIHKRLTNFIENHELFYKFQFGFRNNHNTSHALITLTTEVSSSLDRGHSCLGVFLDLKKAFDTVDPEILLLKLEKYGVRGTPLDWFRSYLTDRTQCVKVLESQSPFLPIRCGVPQGSVLGPLLFLLYINDIYNVCPNLCPILFADDTNLFISGENITDLYTSMNAALDKILVWLRTNKLSINIEKTHYMLFTNKKSKNIPILPLYMNNIPLHKTTTTKFLGVVIDDKLTFKDHVDYIRKKISKNIGIISKAKQYFDVHTLSTLYYTFIFPYLSYCIEVWGSASVVHLNSLLKLQKRVCRIISHSDFLAHSLPLFKSLKILTVYDIYQMSLAIFMFRFNKRLLPSIFNTYFTINRRRHSINTRQLNNFHIPFCRLSLTQKFIKYKCVIFWNNLDLVFKQLNSLPLFKKSFKKHLLSKY